MKKFIQYLPFDKILEFIRLPKVLNTLIVIFILWIFHFIILQIVKKKTKNREIYYKWRRRTFYTLLLLAILLIGKIWVDSFHDLWNFFALFATGLVLVHKETIMNLTGSLFIHWRNLFKVGDRIMINGLEGDVIKLGFFYLTLLEVNSFAKGGQQTGRLIKVPNSLVITNTILNYTSISPFLWDEITIALDLSSNMEAAEKIMQETANKYTKQTEHAARLLTKKKAENYIDFQNFSAAVYFNLRNTDKYSWYEISVRFLCKFSNTKEIHDKIMRQLIKKINAADDIFLQGINNTL